MSTQIQDILKKASLAIKELEAKNSELEAQLESQKLALELTFDLVKKGSLSVEDIDLYFKEASTKSVEELSLIKEASNLNTVDLNTFSVAKDTIDVIESGSVESILSFLME